MFGCLSLLCYCLLLEGLAQYVRQAVPLHANGKGGPAKLHSWARLRAPRDLFIVGLGGCISVGEVRSHSRGVITLIHKSLPFQIIDITQDKFGTYLIIQ